MLMLCYKCNHSWNYKGKNTEERDNITCPRCMYKLILGKALVESPSEQKLLSKLPSKKQLPSLLLNKLPTTSELVPSIIKEPEIIIEEEVEEDCIRIIPRDHIIRIIPRDLLKVLKHQRSFM